MNGRIPGALADPAESEGHPAEKGSPRQTWWIALLLLLSLLPYLNTLQNGFVYDDNNEILTNPYIRSFAHLEDIFSTRILAHLGVRAATNYYRPISILGFLLCYKAFGLLPYGFHLVNLLLNSLIVCLVFGLTKRLFQNAGVGFVAAALFALHPIHSESVAWVSAVTDLELAVFYLATFWFFLNSAKPHGARSELAQFGMAGSFVLALLSKEQAVTLPLLATIYEHGYRSDRGSTRLTQKLARYGVLWLLLVAYVLFRIRFFGAFAPVVLTPHVSWYEAVLSGLPLAGQYLWKMVWPYHLSAYYAFHKSVTPLDARVMAGALALALCVLAFWGLWKRAARTSFGLAWFFLTLAPVLNSRWLGPNVFAERYLYLPSVGLCWVAAWGIFEVWTKPTRHPVAWRSAFATALGVIAVLSIVRIVARNRDWSDDLTYYHATLAAEPEAASLRLNLGAVYWNRMQADAAEREWKGALKASPGSTQVLNNLGLVCASKKHYDEAREYFERSMRLRPNNSDAHLNLGRLEEDLGRPTEAELQLRAAVALAPLNIQARNELGNFYMKQGRWADAEAQFRESSASIANTGAADALGDIYTRLGRRNGAEQAYRQALALDDFDSHAQFGLAAILEATGRRGEALRHYQAGLRNDPRNRDAQAAVARLASNSPYVDPSHH